MSVCPNRRDDGGTELLAIADADSDFIAAWMAEAFFGSDYGPVNIIGRRVRCTRAPRTRPVDG